MDSSQRSCETPSGGFNGRAGAEVAHAVLAGFGPLPAVSARCLVRPVRHLGRGVWAVPSSPRLLWLLSGGRRPRSSLPLGPRGCLPVRRRHGPGLAIRTSSSRSGLVPGPSPAWLGGEARRRGLWRLHPLIGTPSAPRRLRSPWPVGPPQSLSMIYVTQRRRGRNGKRHPVRRRTVGQQAGRLSAAGGHGRVAPAETRHRQRALGQPRDWRGRAPAGEAISSSDSAARRRAASSLSAKGSTGYSPSKHDVQ